MATSKMYAISKRGFQTFNVLCRKFQTINSIQKTSPPVIKPQPYKYFLILDLEATCDKGFNSQPVQEVIEFPVIKLNAQTLKVEGQFHEYVRPRLYPELTDFCTTLTGIIQDEIDQSSHFPEVLSRYQEWHKREVGSAQSLVVTCGDWDLLTMMPRQCTLDKIGVPECFRLWHNIKLSYCSTGNNYTMSLPAIIKGLGIESVGRPHRGIDDCYNISNVVCELIRRGLVIVPTKRLHQ